MKYNATHKKVELHKLDIFVTSKCNLRCKYCSNLMQYHSAKQQRDIDIDAIERGIDTLMSAVEWIDEVYILGGEPFLYPDLPDVIRSAAKYKCRIGNLSVVSNGLRKPRKDAISALLETDTTVKISLYPRYSEKQAAQHTFLQGAGINAEIFNPTWTYRTQKANSNPEVFFKDCCRMAAPCVTLKGDKLFYCEFAANAYTLGCESKYLDLNYSITSADVYRFLDPREPFAACRYCNGGYSDLPIEAAAHQLDAPLILDWREATV